MSVDLLLGDCLTHLKSMPDDSVDSVVTDPPYGLSFMGKRWDYDVPSVEVWAECLRVLKPGGHLLAFAGTRTQHRMAVRIEDAGFEIRDMIAWVYGSGFPKSLDVSKAIDKEAGAEREVVGQIVRGDVEKAKSSGVTIAAAEANKNNSAIFGYGVENITIPAPDAARQWQGWGTALKPALEPITVARKPLCGTVAENVLTHGCGGLNVDGCRVGTEQRAWKGMSAKQPSVGTFRDDSWIPQDIENTATGRWPANLIHDGSEEVLDVFPNAPGQLANASNTAPSNKTGNVYGKMNRQGEPSQNSENNGDVGFKMKPGARRLDKGSAARFFYCAKASKKERGGSKHPTVKPLVLMQYLVRLVTPPHGLILDPFMGTGTTGEAAVAEGFRFVGIEQQPDYYADAQRRLNISP